MATIIASHMNVNIAPELTQLWPGIRIHAIPIVQPPGIGIAPVIIRADDSVNADAAANTTTAVT
jgi:hypothetical protein